MSTIKNITTYRVHGKTFTRLSDIKTMAENAIGKVIDSADVTLTPKQKLNMLQAIIDNRSLLTSMLNIEYETEDSSLYSTATNILDH